MIDTALINATVLATFPSEQANIGTADIFMNVAIIISSIALVLVILLFSVSSVVDVLRKSNWLPKKWLDKFKENERENLITLLKESELLPPEAYGNESDEPPSITQIRSDFKFACKEYVERGKFTVGYTSQREVEHLVNLRVAFIRGRSKEIVALMYDFIRVVRQRDNFNFDCIVSRTATLDLLGYEVAKRLDVNFILYHDNPIIKDKHIDHYPANTSKAIIVVDGCVGADTLVAVVQKLRSKNYEVSNAFCFYILSYESEKLMQQQGVRLHYLEFFDDDFWESLSENS